MEYRQELLMRSLRGLKLTEQVSFSNSIGAVAIGRNEGERLRRCLQSLQTGLKHIVYVDSGSTDGSVEMAESLGVLVIQLDMKQSFTAARARNAGLGALLQQHPELEYVQFVDGDCEVQPEWLSKAFSFMQANIDFAAVCGRRRERFPHKSIYNQLCDIEWDTPPGEAAACGGDALFRISALKAVNGYRDSLIAGEEPEMCYRMRQLGWKIMRLDAEMTLHDAAMTRIGQWWKRNQRAGHAYAESYALHGNEQEHFRKKDTRSIVIWAALIPLVFVLLGLFDDDLLILWLLYPLQIIRLAFKYTKQLDSFYLSFLYALSNVLGKWPQLVGVLSFLRNHASGQQSKLIEYK